jgi:uncharacterized glyoxalase superfamily protein PhnB
MKERASQKRSSDSYVTSDGSTRHSRSKNLKSTLAEESPKWRTSQHAVDAGAKLVMPVSDAFWGDRYGQVEDPFGHRWSIATHVKDMTDDEIKNAIPAGMECGSSS